MHVSWLRDAILDIGGQTTPAAGDAETGEPAIQATGKGRPRPRPDRAGPRRGQAFVDKWRPRVAALSHARHRTMLNVILGETLEHKRFFDQAAGRPHRPPRPPRRRRRHRRWSPAHPVDRAVTAATRRPVAIALGSNLGDRRAAHGLRRRSLCPASFPTSSFQTSSKPSPEGRPGALDRRAAVPQCRRHREDRRSTPARCSTSCSRSSASSDGSGPTRAPRGRSTSTSSCSATTSSTSRAAGAASAIPRAASSCSGRWPKSAPESRDPVTGLRVAELLRQLLRDESR